MERRDSKRRDPQIFHDRSKHAEIELSKLLISLSTGTLAIYFFAVTGKPEPPITLGQKIIALIALILLALAILAGIINLFSDSKRYWYLAKLNEETDPNTRQRQFADADIWLNRVRFTFQALIVFFFSGIVTSVFYIVFRLFRF